MMNWICVLLLPLTVLCYPEFQCPSLPHWDFRARSFCNNSYDYRCLWDYNKRQYVEQCDGTEEQMRGFRRIFSGGTTRSPCSEDRYQPFKYTTHGNYECIFQKSNCTGVGQVVFDNGTRISDKRCACDHSNNYIFMHQPKHQCYCEPAIEDCSCIFKTCPDQHIIDPDNQCRRVQKWSTSFRCKRITNRIHMAESTIDREVDNSKVPTIASYAKFVAIGLLWACGIFVLASLLGIVFSVTKANKKLQIEAEIRRRKEKEKQEIRQKGKEEQEKHRIVIEEWEKDEETFTITRATEYVAKLIEKEDVVVVTGDSGSGKSSILHHVALELKKNKGYDIIQLSCPVNMKQYRNIKKNEVFIVDDICGKNFINEQDLQTWYDKSDDIKQLLQPNKTDTQEADKEKHGHMKILVSCRLHIFEDTKFKSLKIFNENACDLETKEHLLNNDERLKMIKKYTNLSEKDTRTLRTMLDKYPYFPLLCKMAKDKPVDQVTEIVQSPIESITNDIMIRIENNKFEFCAMVLCVLFNEGFNEEYTNPITTPDNIKQKVTDIVETSFEIDLSFEKQRTQLIDTFNSLNKTYVKKTGLVYTIAHDKLYDIIAVTCGRKLLKMFITYAPSFLIAEQFRFKSVFLCQDDLYIYLPKVTEHLYFDRIFRDLKEQDGKSLFNNQQLKEQKYRDKVMEYIKQNKKICKTLFLELDGKCMKSVTKRYMNSSVYSHNYTTTPLIEASKTGFNELVEYLISINCNVDKTDSCGKSSLYFSCINGHLYIVEQLITKGANIQNVMNIHEDLLYDVCARGHTDILQMLLDRNADISQCDQSGQTPLYLACRGGHTDTVQLLLDQNAAVSQPDKAGHTPLYVACERGHTAIVQLLINRNADVSQSDEDRQAQLYLACKGGHTNIVQFFLDRNADVSQCGVLGQTPLYVTCEEGHTDIVQLLLGRNADVSQCGRSGRTPLYVACAGGHTDIVQLLLDQNAAVSQPDKAGQTPLYVACERGHTAIVQLLIDRNADVSKGSSVSGQTPLYAACERGHTDIVKLLLDRNADVSQCDRRTHWTPLNVACERGQTDIVTLLLDRNADVSQCDRWRQTSLSLACERGHTDTVQVLLDRNADVTQCGGYERTPLFVACDGGHKDIVQLLLDRNADVSQCDRQGQTPLYVACQRGHTYIVQLLLDRNADVSQCDVVGNTPLFAACNRGHTDIVKMLLDKNADVSLFGMSGRTPLFVACERGHTNIVQLLLERNADPSQKDRSGRTPLDVTMKETIKNILKDHITL